MRSFGWQVVLKGSVLLESCGFNRMSLTHLIYPAETVHAVPSGSSPAGGPGLSLWPSWWQFKKVILLQFQLSSKSPHSRIFKFENSRKNPLGLSLSTTQDIKPRWPWSKQTFSFRSKGKTNCRSKHCYSKSPGHFKMTNMPILFLGNHYPP